EAPRDQLCRRRGQSAGAWRAGGRCRAHQRRALRGAAGDAAIAGPSVIDACGVVEEPSRKIFERVRERAAPAAVIPGGAKAPSPVSRATFPNYFLDSGLAGFARAPE